MEEWENGRVGEWKSRVDEIEIKPSRDFRIAENISNTKILVEDS